MKIISGEEQRRACIEALAIQIEYHATLGDGEGKDEAEQCLLYVEHSEYGNSALNSIFSNIRIKSVEGRKKYIEAEVNGGGHFEWMVE